MPFASAVKQWFKLRMSGSLHFPDGWYGRPYDNQHILSSIEESGNDLWIVLDHNLVLKFEGLLAVSQTDRELSFGPFSKLRFERRENGRQVTKYYDEGEVKIVAAPG